MLFDGSNTSLVDSKGRLFDDVYIYYGEELISHVDDYEIRNRIWKSRIDHFAPKDGYYCDPEEFFGCVVGYKHSRSINKNFRNVQYIKTGTKIYWVYCLNMNDLYRFKFIGNNMSIALSRTLLTTHGYELGFKRKKIVDTSLKSRLISDQFDKVNVLNLFQTIEVWYNPETLKLFVMKVEGFNIVERRLYYKKFESEMVCTPFTNKIFDTSDICVPLVQEYDEDSKHDWLFWTTIIDMSISLTNNESISRPSYKPEAILHDVDYTINELFFNKSDYENMLRIIFNKR